MKKFYNSKTNFAKVKWYLIFDGKNHKIVNDITEYKQLKVVIVELTAQQAAQYMFIKQTTV